MAHRLIDKNGFTVAVFLFGSCSILFIFDILNKPLFIGSALWLVLYVVIHFVEGVSEAEKATQEQARRDLQYKREQEQKRLLQKQNAILAEHKAEEELIRQKIERESNSKAIIIMAENERIRNVREQERQLREEEERIRLAQSLTVHDYLERINGAIVEAKQNYEREVEKIKSAKYLIDVERKTLSAFTIRFESENKKLYAQLDALLKRGEIPKD